MFNLYFHINKSRIYIKCEIYIYIIYYIEETELRKCGKHKENEECKCDEVPGFYFLYCF